MQSGDPKPRRSSAALRAKCSPNSLLITLQAYLRKLEVSRILAMWIACEMLRDTRTSTRPTYRASRQHVAQLEIQAFAQWFFEIGGAKRLFETLHELCIDVPDP